MRPRKQNLPKYVTAEKDSRGRLYIYFRKRGKPKVRMPGKPWSPAFMAQYHALLGGEAVVHTVPQDGDTLRWLVDRYFAGAEFRRLNLRTQRVRRQILDACLGEPVAPGETATYAGFPLAKVTGKAIRILRDRKADAPEAANGRVKALRQVFAWGVEYELTDRNPARDIPYIKTGSQGFHSWTLEEVEQYEARHAIGTRARLALALLLYTGQRRSDVVRLGRRHLRDGWLTFTQAKNRARKPVRLEIPLRPELADVIAATETVGVDTFLVTEFGRPFTANGFGNRFRKWCDLAGLPHCSAHGLRKAAAARLADAGATAHQIMAITGHQTLKEVERYTRAAQQRKLAGQAFKVEEG